MPSHSPSNLSENERRRQAQAMRQAASAGRGAETQAQSPPMAHALNSPAHATPDNVRQLQHSHGNHFVQRWLQDNNLSPAPVAVTPDASHGPAIQRTPLPAPSSLGNSKASSGIIQREEYGPLPTNPAARQKEIRRRIRARQAREHNEKHGWFGSKTFLGKAMGWFSYGDHEVEDSQEYFDSGGGLEQVEDDFEEEEEAESAFSLSKIEINLKEGEFERGALRGTGGIKGSTEGLKAEGELAYDTSTTTTTPTTEKEYSVRGRKVKTGGTRQHSKGFKAKAGGELSTDGEKTQGKGEINFIYGSSDKVAGTLGWDIAGSQLEGVGSVSHFSGAKLGAKAKGSYDHGSGGFSAKGKASAFLGESVDVKIKVGAEEVGTFKGNVGLSYGVGGELSGSITWEGGVLSLAGKGKAAVGVGMGMGYRLEINTQSLSRRFWSWLSGWGSWAWDVLDSVDEPLMI